MKKLLLLFCATIILLTTVPASAAQNHSISFGYNLYSMTYRSMSTDNGICYAGAQNWTTAAGTTMTQSTSSLNYCYYEDYVENWYGLYSKGSTTRFTIDINKRRIAEVFTGSIWNAAVNVATHEFGHAQYLGDHDTEKETTYKFTSVMSYERDRTDTSVPKSHDLTDLKNLRNP